MQGFRLYQYTKNQIIEPAPDCMFLMNDRATVMEFNAKTGAMRVYPHRAMGIELQPLICYHEGRPLFAGDAVCLFNNPDMFLEIRYNEDTGEVTFHDPATGKDYRYDSIKTEITSVMDCVTYNRWKNECSEVPAGKQEKD